ncbi:MAG: TetR/AcrR family transcriptional regulator [Lachnospiraceae bacterium]|nr:TetR/AcrR family transcriptional regulator [Lachnospiraceae bacterium]
MRIVKEAQERRNEILDVAEHLFMKKGFDGTSTNDILQAVGIARGTLYYHFKSKEDIMDALIDRMSENLLKKARISADDRAISVHERLISVILAIKLKETDDNEFMEHIHKPQNALMHQKIQKTMISGITPILTDVVQDGIQQGLFHTLYAYEAVEMMVVYLNTIFDNDLFELTEEETGIKMQAFLFNVGRLLQIDPENLDFLREAFGA